MQSPVQNPRPASNLPQFLRDYRDRILLTYEPKVRTLSPARELSRTALIDHVPLVLERMAAIIEAKPDTREIPLGKVGKIHAVDRLSQGYDLVDVVAEYGFLRQAILEVWQAEMGETLNVGEVRLLDRAFDESLKDAAVESALLRGKVLRAVDALSEVAFGPGDLDAFLGELIRLTMGNMRDVDTAAILLREGDDLRVRATYGLDGDLGRVFSLGQPVPVRDAAGDLMVASLVMRQKGVHALYGVPLIRDTEVLGVAHIGSLTAHEFSEDDKFLFRAMAGRAASVIAKSRLMAQARKAASIQAFLSAASKQLSESLDYDAPVNKISRLAVPTIADWCVVDLFEDKGLRRVSVAHSEPSREELIRELDKKYPIDLNSETGVPRVLRTGKTDLATEIPESVLIGASRDPDHLRMLRELELRSYIIAPLLVHGQVIGALTLVMAVSGRSYDATDVDVAEELSRRIATAIETARLHSQAQAAIEAREQILAVVSHDMRNHLGVIRMANSLVSRLLEMPTDISALRKPTETIDRVVVSMRRLVDDLLDIAAINVGRMALECQVTGLQSVLDEACP